MGHEIVRITSDVDLLGESPVWSMDDGVLYWVDIRGAAVRRLDGESCKVTTISAPSIVGCIGLRASAGLVAALQDGFYTVDFARGLFTKVADPESHLPDHRFNDGRCDRTGAFWASTMNDVQRSPTGALYRLAPDGSTTRHVDGWVVPNGIAFSPKGDVMYFADTFADRLLAMDFDPDAGCVGAPRLLADTRELGGHPDGATVDAEGCLWSALHGAGRLVRVTPAGVVDRVIELPVSQPTSCTFGGSRLNVLYVTSASQRLGEQERLREPWAGNMLAFEPGVVGLPEPSYLG